MSKTITAYKGFNKDMTCRGFQFEIGKEYTQEGKIGVCDNGFHACEYPLDVFDYYSPAGSTFAIVEQSGDISHCESDSKLASEKIKIKASIDFGGLVKAAIEYTTSRAKKVKTKHVTGYRLASSATGDGSASSATGDGSASSATGYGSASSATGHRSASSATGYRSASSAIGRRSASSATGDGSASSATGYGSASSAIGDGSASEIKPDEDGRELHAVACALGEQSKARAPQGSAIVCVCRNLDGELIHIKASKVGDNGIKPDTWYTLNASGEFVEVD